jgi:hypothetical protein
MSSYQAYDFKFHHAIGCGTKGAQILSSVLSCPVAGQFNSRLPTFIVMTSIERPLFLVSYLSTPTFIFVCERFQCSFLFIICLLYLAVSNSLFFDDFWILHDNNCLSNGIEFSDFYPL